MFKGKAMGLKKAVFLVAFLGAVGLGQAENGGLAKLQAVPVGERVANYLQAYLTTVYTVVEAKSSGGILDGHQTYRAVVVYDLEPNVLDITLIGMQQDTQTVQDMMDAVRKIVLKLNPKLQKDFKVTLQDEDLSMDYLYAKSGQILARYQAGKFFSVPPPGSKPNPSSTPLKARSKK